ncbi:MAG: zinc-ribbon domain-containing protein [Saprospiraceae bacterium]|nr:zinc-ribbon domain-containing protein [Saprospiraceae bacterium]
MKSKIPISISHSNLLEEWDYSLNERHPNDFTKGSNFKAFWKCKKNHSWQAAIYSRTNGHGCPFCRSSTSLNEMTIFSELSYVFQNSIHRYIKGKNEIDIFLPDVGIGVEYDGLRWHIENDQKDRNKNLFFQRKGIKIIRIRQKGLPKITDDDIIVEKKIDTKEVINDLLKIILKTGQAKAYQSKILEYIKLDGVANDSKYQELLAYHPFPFKGRSLEDKFPALSAEWDTSKNKNLTPNHFYPKSATNVWWKCSMGHEWLARISHRVSGSGCPICSGRVAGSENNLSVINLVLAKEWHYQKNKLLPYDYLPNSGKKVWWKCTKGHEWQATIASRNSNGAGCPFCSGNDIEESDSIFYNKVIMSIWNFEKNNSINPKKLSKNSNKKVWWKCKNNHEWESIIANISKGSGCPFCSGHKPTYETSFGNNHPDLLKEWDYSKNDNSPFDISCQSKKKVWWKCNDQHQWQTTVQNRTKGSRCPYCTNKIVLIAKSLYTLEPELMKEWDFSKNHKVDPKTISLGSGLKAWWICKNGHSWEASIYHRTKNKSGCPFCSNKKISIENSIVTKYPQLMKEWDFKLNSEIKPEMYSHGSTKKVWWKCAKGHSWLASIGKRTSGRSCPECYKLKRKNST